MEFRMSVLLFLLFFVGIHESKACLEVERLALLEFKELFNLEGYDADYFLPSWVDDPTSECCEWERVSCNGTTGHVTKLSLDNIRQVSDDDCFTNTTLLFNISIFQYFDDLLLLNLSCNSLECPNHKKGSENVLRLKKLETLDLSLNYLNGSIIPSIKGLASLKNLNLGQNQGIFHSPLTDLLSFEHLEMLNLQGCLLDISALGEEGFAHSIKSSKLKHLDISGSSCFEEKIFPSFGKLSSLEYLDLSFTDCYIGSFPIHVISGLSNLSVLLMHDIGISGTLSIQNQTALPKLQVLDLSGNGLNSISSEFGALISLKVLDLSSNHLNDSAIEVLCGMKMLEELDLSSAHNLTVIPRCLHNLTSLKVLDLSGNAIHGQFPSSLIAALTSLKYINIRDNYFHGVFSFSAFNNHSHLESVFLGSYDQSFKVETEVEDWMPKFQLKTLVLSKCNLNLFGHKKPSFLPQQHELRFIDLSDNNIGGRFPGWILANNSRMETCDLSNNSFTGEFNMSLYPMIDLISVDVSKNQIEGILPRNIGNIFPNLRNLQLSRNAFGGSLPSSVGLMRNLEVLDLCSNNFRGSVPETLFECTILKGLKLSHNEFTGNFFSTRYNLSNLENLQLNNNNFTGSMENVNSINLHVFDVSFNFMSGRLPNWINRTDLLILNLRHNSLKGEVSCDLVRISFVDLSENSLSGTLPSCSSMGPIRVLHLQSNNFTGSTPKAFFNSISLSILNLRDNRLSNSIPDEIGNSSSLIALLLGANQLSGLIPKNLCLLERIHLVDLSHNYLSGSIPLCLANMSFRTPYFQFESIYDFCGVVESYPIKYTSDLGKFLGKYDEMCDIEMCYDQLQHGEVNGQIEFMTKHSLNTYEKDILNFMSGLDLSCNNLVGEIPRVGNFTQLRALNLSHNCLTGPIPNTFASLTQLESLDLSHNRLSGEIPSQLTQLTFLEAFSVAYNNLSGRIPYGKAQFCTFERSSYEGNAYLCGKPLDKNCSGDDESAPPSMPLLPTNGDEHWYDIDKVTFFASFSASFGVFFSGAIAFLYVNPYWRQCLFYYGEKIVLSCYYFVSDAVFMLSLHFRRA